MLASVETRANVSVTAGRGVVFVDTPSRYAAKRANPALCCLFPLVIVLMSEQR